MSGRFPSCTWVLMSCKFTFTKVPGLHVVWLTNQTFYSGWIPNYDLVDLDLDEVGNIEGKNRKDLVQAHKLAAEKHDLAYFKQVLLDFQTAHEADLEAQAEAKAAKEASKAKSKKKSKAAADVEDGDNEDVEMADAGADLEVDGGASEKKPKSSKKRKAVADPEESTVSLAEPQNMSCQALTTTRLPKAHPLRRN